MCVCLSDVLCTGFLSLLLSLLYNRPLSDFWSKLVLLKWIIKCFFWSLLVTVVEVPLFHCFPLTCWDPKIKQHVLGFSHGVPWRPPLVWGFQESLGWVKDAQLLGNWVTWEQNIFVPSVPIECCRIRIDFCDVISRKLRVLKAKLNLYTGLSLCDLEGKWAGRLLIHFYLPWKPL